VNIRFSNQCYDICSFIQTRRILYRLWGDSHTRLHTFEMFWSMVELTGDGRVGIGHGTWKEHRQLVCSGWTRSDYLQEK